jgi:hypothetical protein
MQTPSKDKHLSMPDFRAVPSPLAQVSTPGTTPWLHSEYVLHAKLDLPSRYRYFGDRACDTWTVVDEVVRLGKIRVVEEVEELRAEFDTLRLGDVELFARGSIKNVLARPDQIVAMRIAEGEPGGSRKRIDIEPQVRASLIGR